MTKLRFYFSFRSPYAWLALRALEQQGLGITAADSDITYLPFFEPKGRCLTRLLELGGQCLYQPMSKEKHLYIMQDAKRLMEAQGLKPAFPVDQEQSDWAMPHYVYLALQKLGLSTSFVLDAMEARWLTGIDLWQWKTIETLLARRLDNSQVTAVLDVAQGDDLLEDTAQILYQAYKDSVFGVPFMRAGRHKFWGQDRVESFIAQAHQQRSREKRTI